MPVTAQELVEQAMMEAEAQVGGGKANGLTELAQQEFAAQFNPDRRKPFQVKVTRMIDGDTFVGEDQYGDFDTYRMSDSNAPETYKPWGQEQQPGAVRARDAMTRMLEGQTVYVRPRNATLENERGKYNRRLVDVDIPGVGGANQFLNDKEYEYKGSRFDTLKYYFDSMESQVGRNMGGLLRQVGLEEEGLDWIEQYGSQMEGRMDPVERFEGGGADKFLYHTKEILTRPEVLIGKMTESAPLMASTAAGMAVGGPVLGTIAGALSLSGNNYQDLREKGVSHARAVGFGNAQALVEAGIETYMIGRLGGIFKGKHQYLVDRIPGIASTKFLQVPARGLTTYAAGATEEVTQQISNNFFVQGAENERIRWSDIMDGTIQSGAEGGILEWAMGSGASVRVDQVGQNPRDTELFRSGIEKITEDATVAYGLRMLTALRTEVETMPEEQRKQAIKDIDDLEKELLARAGEGVGEEANVTQTTDDFVQKVKVEGLLTDSELYWQTVEEYKKQGLDPMSIQQPKNLEGPKPDLLTEEELYKKTVEEYEKRGLDPRSIPLPEGMESYQRREGEYGRGRKDGGAPKTWSDLEWETYATEMAEERAAEEEAAKKAEEERVVDEQWEGSEEKKIADAMLAGKPTSEAILSEREQRLGQLHKDSLNELLALAKEWEIAPSTIHKYRAKVNDTIDYDGDPALEGDFEQLEKLIVDEGSQELLEWRANVADARAAAYYTGKTEKKAAPAAKPELRETPGEKSLTAEEEQAKRDYDLNQTLVGKDIEEILKKSDELAEKRLWEAFFQKREAALAEGGPVATVPTETERMEMQIAQRQDTLRAFGLPEAPLYGVLPADLRRQQRLLEEAQEKFEMEKGPRLKDDSTRQEASETPYATEERLSRALGRDIDEKWQDTELKKQFDKVISMHMGVGKLTAARRALRDRLRAQIVVNQDGHIILDNKVYNVKGGAEAAAMVDKMPLMQLLELAEENKMIDAQMVSELVQKITGETTDRQKLKHVERLRTAIKSLTTKLENKKQAAVKIRRDLADTKKFLDTERKQGLIDLDLEIEEMSTKLEKMIEDRNQASMILLESRVQPGDSAKKLTKLILGFKKLDADTKKKVMSMLETWVKSEAKKEGILHTIGKSDPMATLRKVVKKKESRRSIREIPNYQDVGKKPDLEQQERREGYDRDAEWVPLPENEDSDQRYRPTEGDNVDKDSKYDPEKKETPGNFQKTGTGQTAKNRELVTIDKDYEGLVMGQPQNVSEKQQEKSVDRVRKNKYFDDPKEKPVSPMSVKKRIEGIKDKTARGKAQKLYNKNLKTMFDAFKKGKLKGRYFDTKSTKNPMNVNRLVSSALASAREHGFDAIITEITAEQAQSFLESAVDLQDKNNFKKGWHNWAKENTDWENAEIQEFLERLAEKMQQEYGFSWYGSQLTTYRQGKANKPFWSKKAKKMVTTYQATFPERKIMVDGKKVGISTIAKELADQMKKEDADAKNDLMAEDTRVKKQKHLEKWQKAADKAKKEGKPIPEFKPLPGQEIAAAERLKDSTAKIDYQWLSKEIEALRVKHGVGFTGTKGWNKFLDRMFGLTEKFDFLIDRKVNQITKAVSKAVGDKHYDPFGKNKIEIAAIFTSVDMLRHAGYKTYMAELSGDKLAIAQRAEQINNKQLYGDVTKLITDLAKLTRVRAQALGLLKDVKSDNYVPHLWNMETMELIRTAKLMKKGSQHMRDRTLAGGLIEGWSLGYELETMDFAEMIQRAHKATNQAVSNVQMIKVGEQIGMFAFDQETVPGGFQEVEIPSSFDKDGNIVSTKLWTRPDIAKHLTNAFGESKLLKFGPMKYLDWVNAQLKKLLLLASLFHFRAFVWSHAVLPGVKGLNFRKGLAEGREAIERMDSLLMEGIEIGGLTIGAHIDIAKTTQKPGLFGKYQSLTGHLEKWLFEDIGANLKAHSFMVLASMEIKRNMPKILDGTVTKESILKAVARRVNNDFGGINYRREGKDPTMMHAMKYLFLGHDWNYSNIRSMADLMNFGNPQVQKMHAKLWSSIMSKYMLGWFVANMAMAGLDDDDFMERLYGAWQDGGDNWAEKALKVMDVNISPIAHALGGDKDRETYLNVLGHFKDLFKWTLRPMAGEFTLTARTKQSRPAAIVSDALFGSDFWGKRYATEQEREKHAKRGKPFLKTLSTTTTDRQGPIKPEEMVSYIYNQGYTGLPIQLQLLANWMMGASQGIDTVMAMGGSDVKSSSRKDRFWKNQK